MTTQAQLNANRQNAQKSTGPRTPEGKRISARNSTAHGLRSTCVLIASDDPAQYQAFHSALMDELAPVGATEYLLADRIAALHWQLQRAAGLQAQAIEAHMIKPPAPRRFDYTDEELTNYETLKELDVTREEYEDVLRTRGKSVLIEVVRQQLEEDRQEYNRQLEKAKKNNTLGAITVYDFSKTRVLERLVVYERRIENSLHKTRRELDALQTRRLAEENQQRLSEENEIPPQEENAPNEPNLDTPANTTDEPNLLPGDVECENHFSQNKANFPHYSPNIAGDAQKQTQFKPKQSQLTRSVTPD
jgi:hypothetical protein